MVCGDKVDQSLSTDGDTLRIITALINSEATAILRERLPRLNPPAIGKS